MAKIVQMGEYHSLFPPKNTARCLAEHTSKPTNHTQLISYSVTQLIKKKI